MHELGETVPLMADGAVRVLKVKNREGERERERMKRIYWDTLKPFQYCKPCTSPNENSSNVVRGRKELLSSCISRVMPVL